MQIGIAFLFLLMTYGATADDACPPTEIVKLAELYSNPHLHPCQKVSAGFSMMPPTSYPTDRQTEAMCASGACRALIKDVLALKPADCSLSVAGVKLNAYKLARSFDEKCKTDKDHEDGKYHPTPKPTEDKRYPTPKPTHNKHYPTPKPTENSKYCLNEDDKKYPTPKPTDSKYPTPKPTGEHLYLAEPKIVKVDNENKPCPMHSAKHEDTKEAVQLQPPMNGTAAELFPLPNTTYKAEVPQTSTKA